MVGTQISVGQSEYTIVDSPKWQNGLSYPQSGLSFTSPIPGSDRCLEVYVPYVGISGGPDQAVRVDIDSPSFPVTNLEGKTTMTQFAYYVPSGFNYGNATGSGILKWFKFEVSGPSGSRDYFINFNYGYVDGAGGQWFVTLEGSGGYHLPFSTAPLLYPGGPAVSSPMPADQWNWVHQEIIHSVTGGVARRRFWHNQQLIADLTLPSLIDTTAQIDLFKHQAPWNDGVLQTQAYYIAASKGTLYNGGSGDWPFTGNIPDIVT